MLVLFGQPKVNGYDAAYFEAGLLGIPSYKFCTARGLSLPNRMNEGLNLQGGARPPQSIYGRNCH